MAARVGSKLWTGNRLTSRLGLQYPIIQGPLGGLSSQRLTASVSNYGGLGSFGAHGLKPEAIRNVIREIKALTTKPFAMNLWVSMEDEGAVASTEEAFHRSLSPLAKHIESVGGATPSYHPYEPIRFEDQVQVLLDEGISVFSFIYGIPSKQILDEFRHQGIVLIGTATTVDEAIALEQAGVDVIAASGFEAGGHRGSFLQPSEDSLTGTMALVPQVVDAVRLPVVAAGGIGDARGIVAAFALGAEGVQMGTAFLACEESGANTLHRKALLSGQARQTALTRGFTGRLARGIKNRLLDELNQNNIEILPYPLQRALVRHLSIPAEKAGRPELLPLWSGQSANLARCTHVRALLDTLVKEISEIGGAVQSWSAHRQLEEAQE
ncbi:NAD(P)H-dependent flavin oxidoreductase [Tunturiibacter gelidoferens]|uniref:NAD(P)H-dependent flavin oxidoreductase n=1 Tax=Tunturiibacter gelidiferens TaxID=3069689 RepID=UPI00162135DA|nr:nitronate monooxygenase [Edaphobacter lichenicola]